MIKVNKVKNISDIDKNFAEKPVIKDGMIYRNILSEPFKIYGLCKPHEGTYKRMPYDIAQKVNELLKKKLLELF